MYKYIYMCVCVGGGGGGGGCVYVYHLHYLLAVEVCRNKKLPVKERHRTNTSVYFIANPLDVAIKRL